MGVAEPDFAALFIEYHPKLVRYIYNRTSDMDLAEEIGSETFVRALSAFQRGFGGSVHHEGWLYRIATNLLIDHYRLRGRRGASVCVDDVPFLRSSDNLDLGCDRIFWQECISKGLASLSDTHKQCVLMQLEGYTLVEIAAELGLNLNTVKTRLHRGAPILEDAIRQELGRQDATNATR